MKRILRKLSQIGKLTFVFTVMTFIVLTTTMVFAAIIMGCIYHFGILKGRFAWWVPLAAICIVSINFGVLFSLIVAHKPLKPLNILLNGLEELSNGNYKFRITCMPVAGYGRMIGERFNKLAEELDHTEMLRGDFVNNFSHEFKTPIVSIRGFAKLIQKGNLTPKEKEEYLAIIVEESSRLSDMATNVLTLTKLENQSIIQNEEEYNLSEQLRTCILLLEKNWSQKEIIIDAEFDEYMIIANEEMMKQVWINLLENAIKFCDMRGSITIKVEKKENLCVSICNTGSIIGEEDKKRIFQKFYQADTSHAAAGNGIGLAIVKRVLDLHGFRIEVLNDENCTIFKVVMT